MIKPAVVSARQALLGVLPLVYRLVEPPQAVALFERIEGIWYDAEAMVQQCAVAGAVRHQQNEQVVRN